MDGKNNSFNNKKNGIKASEGKVKPSK